MRAVAEEAGISLSVLHRQFPRKESLFSATFVAPFVATFERFGLSWRDRADRSVNEQDGPGAFVRELHHNLLQHRHTLVTLLAAGENPDAGLVEEMRALLSGPLGDLAFDGSYSDLDRDRTILMIGLVGGLVLFHPWVRAARGDEKGLVDLAAKLADSFLRPGA